VVRGARATADSHLLPPAAFGSDRRRGGAPRAPRRAPATASGWCCSERSGRGRTQRRARGEAVNVARW